MTKISHRFLANDSRLKTLIGHREPNSIRIATPDGGCALYGPYIGLPAGSYEAVIRFDPETPCHGTARMDVCAAVGKEVVARRVITAEQIVSPDLSARMPFSCGHPLSQVEVRLYPEGGFSADIASVEIDGNAEDLPPVSMSDLPEVSVANAIRKGRNLYEGYQRAIGLGNTLLAGRIAVDPDFCRAREMAGHRTIVGDINLANIFLLIKFYLPRLAFGHIVEFGSYKGGSAIFMAALAETFLPGVQVIAFDTFSGMKTTDRAVDAHRDGAFSDVDFAELCRYVEQIGLKNLTFIQGLFEDTALAVLQQKNPLALVHIDCDLRSAVEYAYDTAKPHMVPGGYWVFDDAFIPDCVGEAEAVEDLLIRRDGLNSEQLYPHYVFREPFEKVMRL